MPRKGGYRVNYYDDDDDDYEEYDYYDDDYTQKDHQNVVEPQKKDAQDVIKTGLWSCPICTYDNDDYMSACDICGVLRNPLVKGSTKSNSSPVGGICKDSGVSIMAKSLFAPPLHLKPKKAVRFEANNDASGSRQPDHTLGGFLDFHRAVSSHKNYKINIAPFKFDAPSPDDLVSNGIRSSTLSTKVKFKDSSSSDLPLKKTNTGADAGKEITIEGLDITASTSKGTDTIANVDKEITIEGLEFAASTSKGQSSDATKNSFSFEMEENAGSVSSSMEKKSSSSMSGVAGNVNGVRAPASTPFKPEKWMLPDQVGDKHQLNLAIVGHVDSGKSTLSGRLLHLLGRISQKEFHKYERDAKQQGKASFAYAWALDESTEERERGITMTVAVAHLDSKNYHIILLDSPGHQDFVPNMIAGATQADAAILVVDASTGAFEAGIDGQGGRGGQTREHAQLIRSFGADQIIVAVNKMDAVEYSMERFDTIKQKLGAFLKSCGFKGSSMFWVPISALQNQNLVNGPSEKRLSWFQGHCLLDAIDSLQPPTRDYAKPLILPICDVLKSHPQGQLVVSGKVETGALQNGSKVLVMPSREMATVQFLERDSHACDVARAGDNVSVSLQGVDANWISTGGVLCHPDFPVSVSKRFELKVLVLEVTTPILIGSQMELHLYHAKEAARVVKILSLLDPKTGKVSKRSPRCLLAKQNAMIEVVVDGEICVEEYTKCRALGRVSLRAMGRTIALGVVTKIFVESEP